MSDNPVIAEAPSVENHMTWGSDYLPLILLAFLSFVVKSRAPSEP